jgi:hypothetical protein
MEGQVNPEFVEFLAQCLGLYLGIGSALFLGSMAFEHDLKKAGAWVWWWLYPFRFLLGIGPWRLFIGTLKWMVSPLLPKKKKGK